jgi:hypothetical protein
MSDPCSPKEKLLKWKMDKLEWLRVRFLCKNRLTLNQKAACEKIFASRTQFIQIEDINELTKLEQRAIIEGQYGPNLLRYVGHHQLVNDILFGRPLHNNNPFAQQFRAFLSSNSIYIIAKFYVDLIKVFDSKGEYREEEFAKLPFYSEFGGFKSNEPMILFDILEDYFHILYPQFVDEQRHEWFDRVELYCRALSE